MVNKISFSYSNYRFFLYLSLISFLFFSCQKSDPLQYLSSESKIVGYNKITDNYKFNSIDTLTLNLSDSCYNFFHLIPEIKTSKEIDLYYSFLDKNQFTFFIHSNDLGEKLKKKMVFEKEIKDFQFKEIFNENRVFISPIDENNILLSSNVDEIRKALKRTEEKSILSVEVFKNNKNLIEDNTKSWLFILEPRTTKEFVNKIILDSLSNIIKYSEKFKTLLFVNQDKGNMMILEGEENESSIQNVISSFDNEIRSFDFKKINIKEANFKTINLSNNKNNFKILIK